MSANVVRTVKFKRLPSAKHAARMMETWNTYVSIILVGTVQTKLYLEN
jgi:hypothetical protein